MRQANTDEVADVVARIKPDADIRKLNRLVRKVKLNQVVYRDAMSLPWTFVAGDLDLSHFGSFLRRHWSRLFFCESGMVFDGNDSASCNERLEYG